MLFVAGPRQCGKTTLAKMIATNRGEAVYFNWDIETDRKKLRTNPYFYEQLDRTSGSAPLIIFDEIHKYSKWKNYLKGAYDRDNGRYKFLVTGSGRLDAFRKGGDSLAGRYFLIHVWPFTLAELADRRVDMKAFIADPLALNLSGEARLQHIWRRLESLSGFPTPYLSESGDIYRAWSATYRNQLVREDVRNLSGIIKIDQLEEMLDLLPSRVASPLSLKNVSEVIGVSFDSIKSWIEVLERFYLVFRLAPFSAKVSRSLKKEQKLYFYDYAQIEDPAARFENMVAVELQRAVTNWSDQGLGKFELKYVRTREKEECDFLITERRKPVLLIECKLSETNVEKSLFRFQNALKVPAIQLVNVPGISRRLRNGASDILVASAWDWLCRLP